MDGDPGGTSGGWAMPGSGAADAASTVAPPVTAPAIRPTAPGPGPPPTAAGPLPLRPMTLADILDGGFAVVKAAPRKVLGIAAAFVVPVQVLVAYEQRDFLRENGFLEAINEAANSGQTDVGSTGSSGATTLLGLLDSLTLPFTAVALAVVIWGWYTGRDVSSRAALGVAARRWWVVVVAWIGVHTAEVVGLVGMVVGSLAFMALFVVTAPAIALEQRGPFSAMGRSWQLVSRRFWPCLGTAILVGLVAVVFEMALGWVGLAATSFSFGWIVNAVVSSAASLISTAVVAASTVLLYLDLRIRTEGLDLELTATNLFDGAR